MPHETGSELLVISLAGKRVPEFQHTRMNHEKESSTQYF